MEKNLSHALNLTLRHKLGEYQIPYGEEGYARIDDVVRSRKISRLGANMNDVVKIVENYQYTEKAGKIRFHMKGHEAIGR